MSIIINWRRFLPLFFFLAMIVNCLILSLYSDEIKSLLSDTHDVMGQMEEQNGQLKTDRNESSRECTMSTCFDYARCPITSNLKAYVHNYLRYKHHFTDLASHITPREEQACLFLVIIDDNSDSTALVSLLSKWNGRNHMIVNLSSREENVTFHTTEAIVASAVHNYESFRPHFDMILPYPMTVTNATTTYKLFPIRRRYLICLDRMDANATDLRMPYSQQFKDDEMSLLSICGRNDTRTSRCEAESRLSTLRQSTFFLITMAPSHSGQTSFFFQQQLHESLQAGSIPVVIGPPPWSSFPFAEVIDWSRASISLPLGRMKDLRVLLLSSTEADILNLRRQGRLIYQNYLLDVVKTAFHIIRERLAIPLRPHSADVRNRATVSSDLVTTTPRKTPASFPNISTAPFWNRYQRWNNHFDPFLFSPSPPFHTQLNADAGQCQNNTPLEFTVVLMTYKREEAMIASLVRLKGLSYLSKIVIVWNDPDRPPSSGLIWPDLGVVPVEVVRMERNSLNNRFLPLDAIETEAVLSLDDDVVLTHDEIVSGFSAWKENRERLVGYVGRSHPWDREQNSWKYDPTTSCKTSMVLTGAAFLHKYFLHAYTYLMPGAFRDVVDNLRNCEDIAMNFLVSHVTRLPPFLMTSKISMLCPNCSSGLSGRPGHYEERSKCLNLFADLYGYMPLVLSRFRVEYSKCDTSLLRDEPCGQLE